MGSTPKYGLRWANLDTSTPANLRLHTENLATDVESMFAGTTPATVAYASSAWVLIAAGEAGVKWYRRGSQITVSLRAKAASAQSGGSIIATLPVGARSPLPESLLFVLHNLNTGTPVLAAVNPDGAISLVTSVASGHALYGSTSFGAA